MTKLLVRVLIVGVLLVLMLNMSYMFEEKEYLSYDYIDTSTLDHRGDDGRLGRE